MGGGETGNKRTVCGGRPLSRKNGTQGKRTVEGRPSWGSKSYVRQDGAGEMDMGQVTQGCVSHGTNFGL